MYLTKKYGFRVVALLVCIRATGALLLAYALFTLSSQQFYSIETIGSTEDTDILMLLMKLLPGLNKDDLTTLGILTLIIAIIRITEAFGLWLEKVWGQWLGVATGIIASGVLMIHLLNQFSWLIFLLFTFCVLKVVYLYSVTK